MVYEESGGGVQRESCRKAVLYRGIEGLGNRLTRNAMLCVGGWGGGGGQAECEKE